LSATIGVSPTTADTPAAIRRVGEALEDMRER
jgi:hypothetical protein